MSSHSMNTKLWNDAQLQCDQNFLSSLKQANVGSTNVGSTTLLPLLNGITGYLINTATISDQQLKTKLHFLKSYFQSVPVGKKTGCLPESLEINPRSERNK